MRGMIKRGTSILILIYLLRFVACTEPYEFTISDYENILIVQGLITNEEGPYKVILTRTIPVNSDLYNFEQNAIVTIKDQEGSVETLLEKSPGVYVTRADFKGKIGNSYQLHILTEDDVEYESEEVILNNGIDLDSIYVQYNELYDFEKNEMVPGIDIKINTEAWDENEENNMFLKWDFEEVWEIEQKWNLLIQGEEIWDYTIDTNQYTCWKYDYSIDILIDNIYKYSSNKLNGKFIAHLDKNNPKPYYGYSILVKQYTINQTVYDFWEMMKENNLDNRDIFNNIPYNAKSNITCCDDEHKVYGYFDASYLSKKRIFLKSPVEGVEFRDFNSDCKKYSSSRSFLEGRKVYIILWDNEEVFYTTQQYCVDCSVVSNTTQEPDFWIY